MVAPSMAKVFPRYSSKETLARVTGARAWSNPCIPIFFEGTAALPQSRDLKFSTLEIYGEGKYTRILEMGRNLVGMEQVVSFSDDSFMTCVGTRKGTLS